MKHRYLIALGSNQRHARHGSPRKVLQKAVAALGGKVMAMSPVIDSAPLGPSRRRYANAAAVLRSKRNPERMLDKLQAIERKFGRKRGGQRWGPRVLDLDIILWDQGKWSSPGLNIPHLAFRERGFVLGPAAAIAPGWRDPVSGLSLAQLHARLTRASPLPKRGGLGEGP